MLIYYIKIDLILLDFLDLGLLVFFIVFLDLGITDAITDKSRTYPPSFVIPVSSTGKGLFD